MKVWHKAVASQNHQIDGDDWNDEHLIEGLDEFISTYCPYSVKGGGDIKDKDGSYTVNLNYTSSTIPGEIIVEFRCTGRRKDSNDAPVILRVDSDSTESNYAGVYFKMGSSGPTYGATSGGGLPILSLQDQGSAGDYPLMGRLECYLNGRILTVSSLVAGGGAMNIVSGMYTKASVFTNPPSLSLIIPGNGYIDELVWRVMLG